MSTFHRVVELTALEPGSPHRVEVSGRPVTLVLVGKRVFAVGDECPHQDASLSKGTVEGTTLICPWHTAIFDLKTGDRISGPAPFGLPVYEVKLEDGGVWVKV